MNSAAVLETSLYQLVSLILHFCPFFLQAQQKRDELIQMITSPPPTTDYFKPVRPPKFSKQKPDIPKVCISLTPIKFDPFPSEEVQFSNFTARTLGDWYRFI